MSQRTDSFLKLCIIVAMFVSAISQHWDAGIFFLLCLKLGWMDDKPI